MKASSLLVGLSLLVCSAGTSSAVPTYSIVPLGFDDLEHTRDDGYKDSTAGELNGVGQVRGVSRRYNGGSADLGYSTWLYDGATTLNIGLVTAEYTRSDGKRASYSDKLNESGEVIGYSQRFDGSSDWGYSAWLYDGATTVIGLTGSEYTRDDGYKIGFAEQLNEAGEVGGYSYRYSGATFLGYSAWLYNGATTSAIGLTGSEHTRSDGFQSNLVRELNGTGRVRGVAQRFSGSTDMGQSAWLFDGATTTNIGLVGGEHTRDDGFQSSEGLLLNDAGAVLGHANRYQGGSAQLGQSAWIYNGSMTIDVGLIGSEHTRGDGYKASYATELNEAGRVIGYSQRFSGNTPKGFSSWLYNGTTTVNIGLTGSGYTQTGGSRESAPKQMNEAGKVIGYSARYNGNIVLGLAAWLYDGTNTLTIGLTGSEHTGTGGYRYSDAEMLNEAGHAAGYSRRYSGSTELGQSAWLYDGATSTKIGLVDSAHTRDDGYLFSAPTNLNEAGQVAGYAERYAGGNPQLGQDAWLYDPALDQTFPLQLSTRSDGYAFSTVDYLGDDGLTLGTYTLFDALDNDLGERAFSFTLEDGLHDLGSLVEGSLSANGWDLLAGSMRANSPGHIIGAGKLTSQSGGQMPYLLTPISADFDGDDNVDDIDLAEWEAAYGVDSGGDANIDGVTDGRDFLIWQRQFNPGSPLTAASEAVPEPSAAVLGLLAVIGGCRVRSYGRLGCTVTG